MKSTHLKRTILLGIFALSLWVPLTMKAQTSATLDVTPGTLQDLLLDLDYTPTQLILKGKLNSTDLSYINNGTGKIASVSDLNLASITLDYDDGQYAAITSNEGSDIGLGRTYRNFYLSEQCRVDTTYQQTGLGGANTYIRVFSNDLSGLFIYTKRFKKVVLPDFLNTIGSYIFAGSSIEEVLLPSNLTEIPEGAFKLTTAISSLDLPNSLTKIGPNAFESSSITSVTASGLMEIEESAFSKSKIQEIDLSNVVELGETAFYNTKQLTQIDLSSLTEIPIAAFYWSGVSEVKFSNKLQSVGLNAFYDCENLTSVTLPESVILIESGAFNADKITEFNVPSGVEFLGGYALPSQWVYLQPTENGVWYFGKVAYLWNPNAEGVETLEIKEGTISISPYFSSGFGRGSTLKESLKKLVLPESLKYIGNIEPSRTGSTAMTYGAFTACKSLEEVNYPAGLISIGDGTFSECTDFTWIPLPENLKSIGQRAFANCIKISSVTLPASIEYLGSRIFDGCDAFSTLYYYCEGLDLQGGFVNSSVEKIVIGANVTMIPSFFASSESLVRLEFEQPDALTPELVIDEQAFSSCTSLKIESLPWRLVKVGDNAFEYVNFGENFSTRNIQSVGDRAFYYTKGIKELEIGEKLQICGVNAFSKMDPLETIIYRSPNLELIPGHITPDGVILYSSPFSMADKIIIGNNVEYIPPSMFTSCSSASEIVFESREQTNTSLLIDRKAFSGIEGITTLILPDVRTAIGESAFADCRNLTSYHIGYGTESIYPKAFYNPSVDLTEIDIPETVTWIGESAFNSGGSDVTLYFHSIEPPTMESAVCQRYATAYVPAVSLEAYKETGLNNCTILPYEDEEPENGITSIESDKAGIYTVYNLQGLKILITRDQQDLENLKPGLYLINGKKILIHNQK